MAKFRINNFKDVCCLTSFSISVAALVSFTPQSTFASQDWGKAEVEQFLVSIGAGKDEWVDFFGGSLSGTNSPDAGDTYAIKRNVMGTGRGYLCVRVRTSSRNSSNSHCGASAVWVKGDHSKNSKVRYRTSLTRYGIHCSGWTYSKDQFLAYSAKGEVISQWEKAGQARAIVPESFEESIARAYCKQQ